MVNDECLMMNVFKKRNLYEMAGSVSLGERGKVKGRKVLDDGMKDDQ